MDTIWTFLNEQIANNQFLAGGAVLAGFGILLAYCRRIPLVIYKWSRRRLITEIDIPDRDDAFNWLVHWLSKHPYQRRCRLWTIKTSRTRSDNSRCPGVNSDPKKKSEIVLSPAPGVHFLFYKRRLIILRRDRKDGSDQGGGALALAFREVFNLTVFSRNKQLVIDLLEEAREAAEPTESNRITVFRSEYSDWSTLCKRLRRPIASVLLERNIAQDMLNDVETFLASEKWYNDLGIPYRRGYLLHGAPGNGKSSLVTAIASELNLDVCILNLSSSTLSDDRLLDLFTNVPQHSLILIEDVDCVFEQRTKSDDKDSITFSGLLNAIDGVLASEGRLLFMTTNHKDKLDPALVRPGRCDIDTELSNATPGQAEGLYLRFFPGGEISAKQFAQRCTDGQYSMAQLQGHLVHYRKSAKNALTKPISVV